MRVRFLKNFPAAPADQLLWLDEADCTSRTLDLPRAGVLPLDAVRFVIEDTLGWQDGFFAHPPPPSPAESESPRARQSAAIAACLQSELWTGALLNDRFREKLHTACADSSLGTPPLSDADLARLRAALRAFGAAWRPLKPGEFLDRPLPAR